MTANDDDDDDDDWRQTSLKFRWRSNDDLAVIVNGNQLHNLDFVCINLCFLPQNIFRIKCDFHREVQRGSESWTCLDSNGLKEVGLQIVWISNEIWTLEAWRFEIRTNGHHSDKLFGLQTKVSVFKRSGPHPDSLKTRPFKTRSSKSPDFRVVRFQFTNVYVLATC